MSGGSTAGPSSPLIIRKLSELAPRVDFREKLNAPEINRPADRYLTDALSAGTGSSIRRTAPCSSSKCWITRSGSSSSIGTSV